MTNKHDMRARQLEKIDNMITIFDGTSGVGGDLIAFAKDFDYVVGCELDNIRYKMLVNNVKIFDLEDKTTLINDDCLKIIYDLNFINIVYLDPPWGGKSYKQEKNLTLNIGETSIDSIINNLVNPNISKSFINNKLKLIVLKLPKNYDIEHLYYSTKHHCLTLLMYKLEKMLIMVFKINYS